MLLFYHKGTRAQRGRAYYERAMNDEQKKIVDRAMERAHRAIEALELKRPRDVSGEIASYRAEIEMLQNEKFMEGVFESWEVVQRGERGTPGKDLKRKYRKRA